MKMGGKQQTAIFKPSKYYKLYQRDKKKKKPFVKRFFLFFPLPKHFPHASL